MLIKRVRIVPLVVLMLVAARCTLADSVDDYVRQQMKEKHIPGAVLIELKDGKRGELELPFDLAKDLLIKLRSRLESFENRRGWR